MPASWRNGLSLIWPAVLAQIAEVRWFSFQVLMEELAEEFQRLHDKLRCAKSKSERQLVPKSNPESRAQSTADPRVWDVGCALGCVCRGDVVFVWRK